RPPIAKDRRFIGRGYRPALRSGSRPALRLGNDFRDVRGSIGGAPVFADQAEQGFARGAGWHVPVKEAQKMTVARGESLRAGAGVEEAVPEHVAVAVNTERLAHEAGHLGALHGAGLPILDERNLRPVERSPAIR